MEGDVGEPTIVPKPVDIARQSLAHLKSILGLEDGELLYSFLLTNSVMVNESPTLRNTNELTSKIRAYKEDYLKTHFSNPDEILKIISFILPLHGYDLLFPYLRQYFRLTRKRFSIWTESRIQPSAFAHPNMFGTDTFPLAIIDPFRGKQPFVINEETVNSPKVDMICLPYLILDSHILQYIDWYINKSSNLNKNICYVKNMLQYFASHNYFYSPFFYFFEATSKGSTADHLRNNFASYIILLCANKNLLIATGELRLDSTSLSNLKTKFNASDFNAIVNRFLELSKEFSEIINEQIILIDLIYCVLIKIVLIQNAVPGIPLKVKLELLMYFLSHTVKTQLGYELILAICYFCGYFQNFLKVQKNMNYEKAKRHLLTCSWDMLLLRQPDLFLFYPASDLSIISSICTNDISLIKISTIYRPQYFILFSDLNIRLTMYEFDRDQLVAIIGESNYSQISDMLEPDKKQSLLKTNWNDKLPSEDFATLKQQLENELSHITS
jgi:hypothetical protein